MTDSKEEKETKEILSFDSIDEAIFYVQQNAPVIDKNSTNPHFKSKYADLPDIWAAIKDIMAEAGLSTGSGLDCDEHGDYFLTHIKHISSNTEVVSKSRLLLQKPTAQQLGSYMTYMRRYNLSSLLGLVTDEDDDGNRASEPPKNPAVNQKQFDDYQERIKATKNIKQLKKVIEDINDENKRLDIKFTKAQGEVIGMLKDRRKEALA